MSSNQTARSVAELSLAPCFRREYSALYQGVADCTLTDKELVGAEQVQALLTDPRWPFADDLCAGVNDSSYSKPAFLHTLGQFPNYINITRVRRNRVFYRQFVPDPDTPPTAGHPRWYGERFALRDMVHF